MLVSGGPHLVRLCPYQKGIWAETGRTQCEREGRDGALLLDARATAGCRQSPRSWREAWSTFSLVTSEETSSASTLMLVLWPPELGDDHVSYLSHSACGALLQWPQDTSTAQAQRLGLGDCRGSQGGPGTGLGGMLGSGENRHPPLMASVVSHPAIVPLE